MTEKRSSMGRFFCGHMAYEVTKGIFVDGSWIPGCLFSGISSLPLNPGGEIGR